MTKRRLGFVTALALLTAGSGALAAPAQAVSGWNYTYSAIVGSETYRMNYGSDYRARSTTKQDDAKYDEVIYMYDAKVDGRGIRVTWSAGSSSGTCVNESGAGTTVPCNMSAAEGTLVKYQFCVKDGSQPVACAPQDGFTA